MTIVLSMSTMMEAGNQLDPAQMTDAQRSQFTEQYMQMFSRNRPKKQDYKFPDTWEEQKERVDEADALRLRGNALFKKGELMEAAKLYEQAVIKFADWYAALHTHATPCTHTPTACRAGHRGHGACCSAWRSR